MESVPGRVLEVPKRGHTRGVEFKRGLCTGKGMWQMGGAWQVDALPKGEAPARKRSALVRGT